MSIRRWNQVHGKLWEVDAERGQDSAWHGVMLVCQDLGGQMVGFLVTWACQDVGYGVREFEGGVDHGEVA